MNKSTDYINSHRLEQIKNAVSPKSTDYNFLITRPNKVIKYIISKYPNLNSQKSYLASIVQELRKHKDGKENKLTLINKEVTDKKIELYNSKMLKAYNKVENEREKNELTDKEKKNWIEWEDVIKVREKLQSKTNKKEKRSFFDYLIVSLYTYQPPIRGEYGTMKVVKSKKEAKDKNENFLVWGKDKEFIIHRYKTASKYGTKVIKVCKDLTPIISFWFKHFNKDKKYLLGEYYSNHYISSYIRKLFKTLTNKDFGINLIRHSYITNMIYNLANLSVKERKEISNDMCHSILQQLLYYKMS